MISLYSGTPGSGKSYHSVKEILEKLRWGRNVIANFPLKLDGVKGLKGHFYYVPDEELTVTYLCKFALAHHKKGKEHQTYIVIDEASRMFNPRDFARPDRRNWCKFMALHRHLGFDMILIAQHDRLLDRQIRYQIEYDFKHRSVSNYKFLGLLLSVVGIKLFCVVQYWYAVKGEKCGVSMIRYRKKLGALYDSYALFDVSTVQNLADGDARSRGTGVPGEHGTARQNGNGWRCSTSAYLPLVGVLRAILAQEQQGSRAA